MDLLPVLQSGAGHKIKCSTDLWLKSLVFVEELNLKAMECSKANEPWDCFIKLPDEIKEYFLNIHTEFVQQKCDDLKLEYVVSLVGAWTTLHDQIKVQELRSYGRYPLKPRPQMKQVLTSLSSSV